MITREMRLQIQRVLAKNVDQQNPLFRANVLTYEVSEIVKSIVYVNQFPDDWPIYHAELKRGLADTLAQIAILCEIYSFDFDSLLLHGINDGLTEFLLHKHGVKVTAK